MIASGSGWSGAIKPVGQIETRTVVAGGVTYIVTDLSEEDYEEYYNGFANRVLWPILHYRLDLAEFTRRDLSGYLRVNEHFAAELDKVLEPDDIVWVHDYHLRAAGEGAAAARPPTTASASSSISQCRRRKSSPPCPTMSG